MQAKTLFKTAFLLFFFCLLSLSACRQSDRKSAKAEALLLQGVQLNCEPLDEMGGIPRVAVYAYLDESKVKLAEINNCSTIAPEDYAALNIPEEALTAVGGQFGGGSQYLYAQLVEQKLRFFIGGVGEGNSDPVYAPLAVYEKKKFQLLRPVHLADLAGYYMHQGVDTSYVLFLGLKGPDLVSKLFVTGEPMPAQKVLQRALPEFASTPDLPFNCDLNTLRFFSNLGDGQFFWQPDSASVTFHQFMGRDQIIAFELLTY